MTLKAADRRICLLLIGFLVSVTGVGSGSTAPEFEVVSIRPASPPAFGKPRGLPNYLKGGPGTDDPERMTGHNLSISHLLWLAYRVDGFTLRSQFRGPDWMDSEFFDFTAKVPRGVTIDQVPFMIRRMLEDRFGLKVHLETRVAPVYRLVMRSRKPKLAESAPAGSRPQASAGSSDECKKRIDADGFPTGCSETTTILTNGAYYMQAIGWTIADLTKWLSGMMDAPVKDGTGLTGSYDFRLTWVPTGAAEVDATPPGDTLPSVPQGPDISQSIEQQLGLKFVKIKDSISVLVVDSLQRNPTEN